MGYYDPRNTNRHVSSLKVIPIKINELKTILQRNIKYKELYEIFENAYNSNAPTHNWYDQALIANL